MGGEDGNITIWDPKTGKHLQKITGHEKKITAVAVNPDGTLLATGSLDHSAKVLDLINGQERKTLLGVPDRASQVTFSPNGQQGGCGL